MTNDQVLLVTGGSNPNSLSSTEVSLQNHKVKILFRTNFLNLYPLPKKYLSTKYLSSFFSFLPQIATYTSSSALSWRIVETGDLPSARSGLRAAVVENVLYVSGGSDDYGDDLTAILSWDPLQEKWSHAGDLKVARVLHAAVAIPPNAVECAKVP